MSHRRRMKEIRSSVQLVLGGLGVVLDEWFLVARAAAVLR